MGARRNVRTSGLAGLLAATTALGLTGCTTSSEARTAPLEAAKPSASVAVTPAAVTATVTPADGATDVPTATELTYAATNGTVSAVELTDSAGGKVDGAARPDGSGWLPARQLKYATRYVAKVTAKSERGGAEATVTSTFTTMAKPAKLIHVSTQLADDGVYGVAMPVIINFGSEVPAAQRAAVQSRVLITSDPPQVGGFHWFHGKELHFRPREYWQAGTKLTFRVAVGGLPLGANRYGGNDVHVRATIGRKLVITADNATKQLTVAQDGQPPKVVPVSFGKPRTPSSSGHMMIMTRRQSEIYDSSTVGVPANSRDGYRMKVYWSQRITWSGQFLHSAPWSVSDQGRRNVSHGCINLSPTNAEWVYKQTRVGDPVIVTGTEKRVQWGNGWTDWDVPFEEYIKGSATAAK
ncbi:MAG TPA: Ig-like domain-containing protein [Micromonosporaceae bacterium]|nr:Ig-like domain-containing protein [Micromonosporaceae bacterium]